MSDLTLADLQHQFRDALHYQPHNLPLAEGVSEPDALLQVYRNNFVMTLTECLETVYPVVKALVGETCFHAVARHHVLTTPMKDACADRYGDGFAETLRALPNIIERVPYLADMADVEWYIQRVNRAPLPDDFPFDALAQVAPDDVARVKLSVAKTSAIGESRFSVVSLWQAVSADDEEALSQLALDNPQHYLVQKNQQGIRVIELSPQEAALLQACQVSALGGVAPDLLPHLSDVMQHGVFDGFALTNH